METLGAVSLIPVAVVIVMALITKRATESLIVGTLVGAAIFVIYKGTATGIGVVGEWWNTWFDYLLAQIGNSAIYIVMFGMFGTFIRLLDDSGSALGFAEIGAKIANSRKKTLLFSWFLGLVIFISDFLNALGVGVAMRSLTDKWKVSREYLAYIVNSVGASACIVAPISSWGVFYSSQLEKLDVFGGMTGFSIYVKAVPFMFYAWFGMLIVPLFITGVIPLFGPMKKSEERALTTGKVFPEWHYEGESAKEMQAAVKPSSAWNFIIPMIVLIVVALKWNITLAAILASLVCAIMLKIQKIFTLWQCVEKIIEGFKDFFYVTVLIIAAFLLQDFNNALGLTEYVIQNVTPLLSPGVFPAIIFIVVAALAFGTGSFWGVAVISFPIVLPLAVALDVNLYLTVAAVATATAFGSQACFYSDSVTVVSATTGIRNMDYVRNALPLIAVPVVLTIITNLIFGFIL